jgi:hypothetical protein
VCRWCLYRWVPSTKMWLHRLQRSIVRVVDAPPPWPGSSQGASGAGCSSWQWWVTQCWKKDTGDSNLEKIVLILTPKKIRNPRAHYKLHKKPKLFKWIVYLKIDKGFHFSNNTIKWWNVSKNSDKNLNEKKSFYVLLPCWTLPAKESMRIWRFDDWNFPLKLELENKICKK